MSGQSQIRPQPPTVPQASAPVERAASSTRISEVDALLADIDTVLETNATAFVQGFVQKGGE